MYEQEAVISMARKYLSHKQIRMVYKVLDVVIPRELKQKLKKGGAVFWDSLIGSQNRYLLSTISTSLGFYETGIMTGD